MLQGQSISHDQSTCQASERNESEIECLASNDDPCPFPRPLSTNLESAGRSAPRGSLSTDSLHRAAVQDASNDSSLSAIAALSISPHGRLGSSHPESLETGSNWGEASEVAAAGIEVQATESSSQGLVYDRPLHGTNTGCQYRALEETNVVGRREQAAARTPERWEDESPTTRKVNALIQRMGRNKLTSIDLRPMVLEPFHFENLFQALRENSSVKRIDASVPHLSPS